MIVDDKHMHHFEREEAISLLKQIDTNINYDAMSNAQLGDELCKYIDTDTFGGVHDIDDMPHGLEEPFNL